ncbi:hypothetical protein CLV94_2120 [Flavobacterium endophyticum]|uniref:GRAM domain-containing protein n=1 Tax=Flavobacterium endophyticum TaxID=1540163 RepID=A0A495MD41_9FLAO|nr:hypothetical protein [Flavobacterium endophyticum]RKS23215.1 hypothetical protein CLV94_2120 [Flavobacterium endophyticum]
MRIRNSLLAGIFFGFTAGIYVFITSKKSDLALVLGVFCTIVFSICFYIKMFSKIDYSLQFQKIDKNQIVYSGLANHYRNKISVGGTLYLLKDRLIFQTNAINYTERHECTILLDQITEVNFVDALGLIKNGLSIIKHKEKEDFHVSKREIWKEQIERLLNVD